MKSVGSAMVAFVAGCVLLWLDVQLDGILAAQSWPAVVTALYESNKLLALYTWQVGAFFAPIFMSACVGGYGLFRVIGSSSVVLSTAVLPYLLLAFAVGSLEPLLHWPGLALYGLSVLGVLAFPLGLLAGWQLNRRADSVLASRSASSRYERLEAP